MEFHDQEKVLVRKKHKTIRSVVGIAGLSMNSYDTMKKRGNLPRAEEAVVIAQELGITLEYLVDGKNGLFKNFDLPKGLIIRDPFSRD